MTFSGNRVIARPRSRKDNNYLRILHRVLTIHSQVNYRLLFVRELRVVGNLLDHVTVGAIAFPLRDYGIVGTKELCDFCLLFREARGDKIIIAIRASFFDLKSFHRFFTKDDGASTNSFQRVGELASRKFGVQLALCRGYRYQ